MPAVRGESSNADRPECDVPGWKRLRAGLLELLLPRRCAICQQKMSAPSPDRRSSPDPTALFALLCPPCSRSLPWLPERGCALCQRELPALTVPAAGPSGRRYCGSCREAASPLDECTAGVCFVGEARGSIRDFKYRPLDFSSPNPACRALTCAFVLEAARRAPIPRNSLVLPVPLHPRRLSTRGFNPAAVLARDVARSSGAHFAPRLLVRERDTPSQTGLGRRARQRNVALAFRCRPAKLAGTVCLVDDVVTTGSTLVEAARTLRRAGATRVVAICAARTPEAES